MESKNRIVQNALDRMACNSVSVTDANGRPIHEGDLVIWKGMSDRVAHEVKKLGGDSGQMEGYVRLTGWSRIQRGDSLVLVDKSKYEKPMAGSAHKLANSTACNAKFKVGDKVRILEKYGNTPMAASVVDIRPSHLFKREKDYLLRLPDKRNVWYSEKSIALANATACNFQAPVFGKPKVGDTVRYAGGFYKVLKDLGAGKYVLRSKTTGGTVAVTALKGLEVMEQDSVANSRVACNDMNPSVKAKYEQCRKAAVKSLTELSKLYRVADDILSSLPGGQVVFTKEQSIMSEILNIGYRAQEQLRKIS